LPSHCRRPINHLVHTRLLNEVIPLLATVRSMSPGRAQSFNYLLSTFFLGTTLPAVPSAVLKGDDNTLEDGEGGPAGATALRMCAPPAYDEWGQPASRKDAPSDLEMSRLGCVSEQNVEALWRAFDQECDMKLFVIAYPSLDTFDQCVSDPTPPRPPKKNADEMMGWIWIWIWISKGFSRAHASQHCCPRTCPPC